MRLDIAYHGAGFAGWAKQPMLALLVSYGLPILLLPIVLYVLRPRKSS